MKKLVRKISSTVFGKSKNKGDSIVSLEPISNKVDKVYEEQFNILMNESTDHKTAFETETGKHAIWRGQETKAFVKWKEKRGVK